jgi:fatty-acyl-CoA synthase
VDVIDREQFASAGVACPLTPEPGTKPERTMSFVCCGTPIPGHDLVIADAGGSALPDRVVGRVHVRGPSLMAGYYGRPEETAAVMQPGGFIDTGDLGYRVDGRLFVTGRSKDMILHNGRNIWPQDVEWAVERVDSLGTGDAAAFAMDVGGREEIIVLVHCRTSVEAERSALRQAVADAVSATTGTPCVVHLVPPRSLPFTSSGKLSRGEAKRRFLIGEIRPL